MSIFSLYFNLGTHHILDIDAYDHILFITTLLAIYQLKHWRKIAVLITAFTIGHASTLVLFTFDIISVQSDFVEFLIAVTIAITAISNIFFSLRKEINKYLYYSKYVISVFFGMIHGMGFSTYLKAMLDSTQNRLLALFAFNLGIEIGQFVVVTIILILSVLAFNFLRVKQKIWNYIISGIALFVSLVLLFQRWPF